MKAQAFSLERYCSRAGYVPTSVWDYGKDRPRKGFVVTGWIESSKLPLRPRDSGMAVMLYEEPHEERILFSGGQTRQVGGEEFWIHIPTPNAEVSHGNRERQPDANQPHNQP